MNTKKVEIEIPANMDVALVRPYGNCQEGQSLVVELKKRQPRRWTFEEIVGKREVYKGDLCFDPITNSMYVAFSFHKLLSNWIAVRKVEDVNT